MRRIHVKVARATAWEATGVELAAAAARVRDRSRGRLDTSPPLLADAAEPKRVRDHLLRVCRAPGVQPIVARGPPEAGLRRILSRCRGWLGRHRRAGAKPAAAPEASR